MERKKIADIFSGILIFCFIFSLFMGMIVTLTEKHEDFSYYENRNLAEFPKYSIDAVIDGSYTTGIESWLSDFSAWREPVIRVRTYIDLKILKRPMVNDIVIGKSVLLPWKPFEVINKAEMEERAESVVKNIKSHKDAADRYGGDFYYVAVPCQYACFESYYPEYMNNRSQYTELSKEILFGKFEQSSIPYIDMMDVYKEKGGAEKFSSKVDNHFDIFGAYETYKAIMDLVKLDHPKVQILEKGDYEVKELPNPYIGSRGRKLFGMMESMEKLSVIVPSENIDFERYNNGIHGASIVYQMPESDTEYVLYSLYMGGDFAHTSIDTSRDKLPSILIYGDSFTNGVESLIWYSFDKMESLDLRHYSEKTLDEFISENKPDIIVCIRDYEALLLTDGNGH